MKDRGYYEGFGGAYLPEILIATFDELVETFQQAKSDLFPSRVLIARFRSCH